MLVLQKNKHNISFTTVWYATKPIEESGIISYREAIFKPKKESTEFETLVSDLTESEEDIISRFSKNCRYEIRRAEKEDVVTEIKTGELLTQKDIEEFCDFFVEFWASKGVEYKDRDKLCQELKEYADINALAVTSACIGGKNIIYHTYIIDKDCVRLYHSASLYRQDDEIPQNLVGMANRYLHKEDMLYFKKTAKIQYDWGGAGTTEDVINITKFKQSFGGTPVTYYDYTEIKGIKAKLVVFLSNLKNKCSK